MAATFMKSGVVAISDGNTDASNPFDVLLWLREGLELETGITFKGILECLFPWKDCIGAMVGMDFTAWLEAAGRSNGLFAEDARERIVRVEVRPFLQVDRQDGGGPADIGIVWDVFGVPETPEVIDGRKFDLVGLSLRHPSEYANVPITVVNEVEVSDVMTGGVSHPWNLEPAIHPTDDGSVTGFTVSPTVLDALLFGLLENITSFGDPETIEAKADYVVSEYERVRPAENLNQ